MPFVQLWIWLVALVSSRATDTRHFGIPWKQRRVESRDGIRWQEALLHPSCLHVARSALRLGGVSWPIVKQKALDAERMPEKPLCAEAVFEHLGGKQTTPHRLLVDEGSLCTAYAALLTNQMIHLRWYEVQAVQAGETRGSDAIAGLEVYSSRRHEAALGREPTSVLGLSRRPVGLGSRRFLALADPRLLSPWRRKVKPRWQKVWDYTRKMANGEQFPPVSIAWREELQEWTWRDGCHRYFASLVNGQFLSVSYKDPNDPNFWTMELRGFERGQKPQLAERSWMLSLGEPAQVLRAENQGEWRRIEDDRKGHCTQVMAQ